MKIIILLPYKENYSPIYPGAVSLFVNSTVKLSNYKNDITVYGNTELEKVYSGNYKNIPLVKSKFFTSQSNEYVDKFILLQNNLSNEVIEIHNRPNYIIKIKKLKKKIVLYFHNDPISMVGSKKVSERVGLLSTCEKIIFNSYWSKNRFLKDLKNIYHKSSKLEVIHQSINKTKIDLNKKKKFDNLCRKAQYCKK